MKTWKISNTMANKQPVKISMITNDKKTSSKGLMLRFGEFCICEPQITASMDMQAKRKFIAIDKNFDNSKINLKQGVAYNEGSQALLSASQLMTQATKEENSHPSKMEEAERNALEYIKKNN